MKLLRNFGVDGFLIGLLAVSLLGFLWPQPGRTGGVLHVDLVSTYGVSIVFFLYGLTLAPAKLKSGLTNWRLHLVVQFGTFLLFPLVVLAAVAALGGHISPELRLGFFFLAALPSTVSSSVAMTSLARGNVPGAIFNASLSSLIGVFVTPLWMAWFLSTTGGSMALGPVILKVLLLILLPIVLGQAARPLLADWAGRNASRIKLVDRAIILAIVYGSISDSVVEGVWAGHKAGILIELVAGSILLFFVVYAIMFGICRIFGFDRPDRIAGMFCGSKKSLATGVPMAKLMFGASPVLGFVLAPIMIYHFFQLVIVSVIASRLAAVEPVELPLEVEGV